jgi:polysaccharide biosynthesis protein PslG
MSSGGRRWLLPLVAVLAALAATLAFFCRDGASDGTPAGGDEPLLLGAQTHPFWDGSTDWDVRKELDLLTASGADVVRVDISWSSLEIHGKRRFARGYVARIDRFMREAHRRRLRVLATLWGTPCWASNAPASLKARCRGAWWRRGVDRYPPRRARDYAAAAAWVAQRWGPQLDGLEVWNEPNLRSPPFLRARNAPRAYARILKTAYPRIKHAAPGLPVVAGALAFSDTRFLKRLYALGIRGHFDALSIHPYSENRAPSIPLPQHVRYSFVSGVSAIRAAMIAQGDGATPLWLTEVGWSTCTRDPRWCVTVGDQARFVEDSIRIAREWPFVKRLIVYNLRNKGWDVGDTESAFGLVRRDFSWKPSFDAFRRAASGP